MRSLGRMGFSLMAIILLAGWIAGGAVVSQAQGLIVLDGIVAAHGADPVPPTSVLMVGAVERHGKKPEPLRLLATRDEKIRIEYGGEGKDTVVISQGLSFSDDGQKFTYPRVGSGFAQLDITGLFLLQQMRTRAVRVETTQERASVGGVVGQRIRVESERSQKHLGKILVKDQADLYVMDNGLLLAVSRSFYEGRPERYTQTFVFSDYRKVNGVSLPHHIDMYIKTRKVESFTIESYQFDTAAEPTLFSPRRAR